MITPELFDKFGQVYLDLLEAERAEEVSCIHTSDEAFATFLKVARMVACEAARSKLENAPKTSRI